MIKQQIQSLLSEGKAQEAIALCTGLCEKDGKDAEAWVLLGASHLQLGDVVNAETAGRNAVRLNATEPAGWNVLIQSLFGQGKTADAIQGIHKLIELNPGSGQLHRQLAEVLRQQQDYSGAIEHYNKAVGCGDRDGGVFAALGDSCMLAGEHVQASDAYEQALHAGQPDGVIYHNLGEAYQYQARLTDAEKSYREAIRLRPDLVEPYINLGRNLQKLGRLDEAIACHKHALGINPDLSAAHHNIALCVYNDQDLEPAADAFSKAIDLNPANGMASCFRGIISLQRGDNAAAEAAISRARQYEPLTDSILESYRYTASAQPDARYFSTTSKMLSYAVDNARVDGLFLEFGVCHGTSINMIASRRQGAVHGFDSFEGLPEGWQVGAGLGGTTEQAGAYTTRGTLPKVPDNVKFHVGVFEDTLPEFVQQYPGPVGFINMDCDLYSSTSTVFQYLGERIVPGTVIIFDEYFCYPEWKLHEYKAFQEFVEKFGVTYEYLAFSYCTGQAVVRILDVGSGGLNAA